MNTRDPLRVAICGYGTAGQAAALFLARQNHQVSIFEKSPDLAPVGAGFLLQPTGLAVLRELGLAEQAIACGARIDALHGLAADGTPVMNMRYRDLSPSLFGIGMQRGALFNILKAAYADADKVHTGVDVTAIDAGRGLLTDQAGNEHGPYDLIVVADGAHSKLRQLFPRLISRDRPYPWGAAWCLVDDVCGFSKGVLEQRYRGARNMLGMLPAGRLPEESADTRRVTVYWSLPTGRFEQWPTQDMHDWQSRTKELMPEATPLLEQVKHPEDMVCASYRDVVLRRWSAGRVVFMGDACHAMSPQLGQGANMALIDAWTLAQCLQAGKPMPEALRDYESLRKKHVGIYQLISRWLTPMFQSHARPAAWLRDRSFATLSGLPLLQKRMLLTLTGTQSGYFGEYRGLPLSRDKN